MKHLGSPIKHTADIVMGATSFGAFTAVTLNWLQGLSYIAAIGASTLSIIWFLFRIYDRWQSKRSERREESDG